MKKIIILVCFSFIIPFYSCNNESIVVDLSKKVTGVYDITYYVMETDQGDMGYNLLYATAMGHTARLIVTKKSSTKVNLAMYIDIENFNYATLKVTRFLDLDLEEIGNGNVKLIEFSSYNDNAFNLAGVGTLQLFSKDNSGKRYSILAKK